MEFEQRQKLLGEETHSVPAPDNTMKIKQLEYVSVSAMEFAGLL